MKNPTITQYVLIIVVLWTAWLNAFALSNKGRMDNFVKGQGVYNDAVTDCLGAMADVLAPEEGEK